MNNYPYGLILGSASPEILEVVDRRDRPLMLMPGEAVRLQGLPHRQVHLALRDMRGRVLLVRPLLPEGPGPWQLPGGCVRAGESREDAALRILRQELGMADVPLMPWEQRPLLPEESYTTLLVTAPTAALPAPAPQSIAESMFLDRDELTGLATHFSDLLAPALARFVTEGYLSAALRRPHSS